MITNNPLNTLVSADPAREPDTLASSRSSRHDGTRAYNDLRHATSNEHHIRGSFCHSHSQAFVRLCCSPSFFRKDTILYLLQATAQKETMSSSETEAVSEDATKDLEAPKEVSETSKKEEPITPELKETVTTMSVVQRKEVAICGALCRLFECVFALVAWAALVAAKRTGYGGAYRYDSYTSLKFAATCAVMHWVFATFVIVFKGTRFFDESRWADLERFGSRLSFFLVYSAAIALAATSTTLHDDFGGASVCEPGKGVKKKMKRRAEYFCQHVDASLTFAICASATALASLYFLNAEYDRNRTIKQVVLSPKD